MPLERMTVTEYAKLVGSPRDTIHKRIKHKRKLLGVKKRTSLTIGSKEMIVLHVDKEEL